METITIIQYLLIIFISVMRPILFKEYKSYVSSTLLLSTICMLIYSLGYFAYKYNKGIIDKEKLKEKLKKGISRKNLFISFLSQIRFTIKFICISMLPLSISIPLTLLLIVISITNSIDHYVIHY